jgi:rubrerythrin
MSDPAKITVPQLLARAYAIEREAQHRYEDLADQMEVHNNLELAALFRKLASLEAKHAEQIKARGDGKELPYISPLAYRWPGVEAPENAELASAHYLMTPHHALKMALAGEERSMRFYTELAEQAADEDANKLALEFAEEEREHIQWVKEWMAKYPKPDADWDEDMDPPIIQE